MKNEDFENSVIDYIRTLPQEEAKDLILNLMDISGNMKLEVEVIPLPGTAYSKNNKYQPNSSCPPGTDPKDWFLSREEDMAQESIDDQIDNLLDIDNLDESW